MSVSTSACNLDRSSSGGEAFCIRRNTDCVIRKKRADTHNPPTGEGLPPSSLHGGQKRSDLESEDCRERLLVHLRLDAELHATIPKSTVAEALGTRQKRAEVPDPGRGTAEKPPDAVKINMLTVSMPDDACHVV